MKKILVLAVVLIAGFALYQYYNTSFQMDEEDYETEYTEPSAGESSGGDAGECAKKQTAFENALYGHETGETSAASLNHALRSFRSCLMEEGFSESEIDGMVQASRNKVKEYLQKGF